jgi:hypothetical protein
MVFFIHSLTGNDNKNSGNTIKKLPMVVTSWNPEYSENT